jgi:hypothetical protein
MGDPAWARELAERAEAAAQSIIGSYMQARKLVVLAATAGAWDLDRAEAAARSIIKLDDQAKALTRVAKAAAGAGDLDRVEAAARSITHAYERAQALANLARKAAPDRARSLLAQALTAGH